MLHSCRQDRRILVLDAPSYSIIEQDFADSLKLYEVWFDRIELPLDTLDYYSWKLMLEFEPSARERSLKKALCLTPQPEIAELILKECRLEPAHRKGLEGFVRLARQDIGYAGLFAENSEDVKHYSTSYPEFDSTASLQEIAALLGLKKRLFGFGYLNSVSSFIQLIGRDRLGPNKMWFRLVQVDGDSISSVELVSAQGTENVRVLAKLNQAKQLIYYLHPAKPDTFNGHLLNSPELWLGDRFTGKFKQ
ncbi:MAG: hypothetical protein LCH37_11345 [Bacteroidetes bacterium]|nr:hypothetical protein [Bacteroidota bacterium]